MWQKVRYSDVSRLEPMDTIRAIRRVLLITLGLNLVATAAKLIIGYWTGALSLIADGFDSVFDAASNVIGLVGIHVASRPADDDYPYGRRKAESMTALVIAMLLFLTTWELITSAVERLRNPALVQMEVNAWSFGALVVSILVHITVVWYELRAGRRLRSDVLVADALHTRADIFLSVSVIGGLIAVGLGFPLADPVLALVVAVMIAKIGIDIIRQVSPTLMDERAMPADQLEGIVKTVPGVLSVHHVRSRGHDSAVYADLHISVDAGMSTDQAHAIAHEAQRRVRERFSNIQDVTIHVEPARTRREKPGWEEITVNLRRLADGLGLGVHDIWVYDVKGCHYAEVHLEADGALTLQQAHTLASALEERAHTEILHLAELTTHIEPKGRLAQAASPGIEESQVLKAAQRLVGETPGAASCHQLQVRRSGDGWAISMHCHLPGGIPLTEAHEFSTGLEARLREQLPGLKRVVIHTEPDGE